MKQLIFIPLNLYQKLLSPLLKQLLGVSAMCRYSPSCSEYAVIMIEKEGIVRGGQKALKRLLSCHPFSKQVAI